MGEAHPIRNSSNLLVFMGQSLVKNYIHIVFSTKHRAPFIDPSIENDLYRYMSGICIQLGCEPIIIGGYIDHVHVLCRLSKKVALMKLLEELKGHSSKYMKTKGSEYANFYWQDGYGAFSVGESVVDKVTAYIANQKQHHSKKTFKNEYRIILKKCNMVYDERYVWD
jgi:REP element-mobilizing transposase RayT